MTTRYDLDRKAFAQLLEAEPSYRVEQVWEGLYGRAAPLEDLTNVPKALRTRIGDELPEALRAVVEQRTDNGDTIKWLWELHDGSRVETVLMHYRQRSTVCVSSQAGCAMACSFCATGQMGFDRHLDVGEIVEQLIRARRAAGDRRVSNVVFMGMGEPLANYDRTWEAVRRINADMGIGARHITISTVGLVPGIRRLAEEDIAVNLAVSLHAANDELRNELVPINRRYPLDELADACEEYVTRTRRRLSIEWALIAGSNDRDRDVEELTAFARPLRAHVNLIPLNPTPGYATIGSSKKRVYRFAELLNEAGVTTTVRDTRGSDIDAACGQLHANRVGSSAGEPS